jgi:phosphoglycerate dehydrogenase-like enzyme
MKRDRLPWIPAETCRRELFGKTVGILGYGTISRELIKLLAPFRAKVLVYSSHCPAETAEREGFTLCGLDELVASSDAVIPLSTLTSRSYHTIDAERLRMMKDDAVIVNTGRGALIVEAALIEELKKGRLFAALDVYEKEPLPTDSPLRDLPNTIILPHMGGKTIECRKKMAAILIRDITRIARGEEPEHTVSRDDYKRMSQKIQKK